MPDISIRGYDGSSGGPIGGGQDRVATQPDFASMTLEEIQAWEAAHNTNPETGTLPASATVPAHVDPRSAAAEEAQEAQAAAALLTLVPGGAEDTTAYNPEQGQADNPELIHAEFSLGEPFVHVVAYLTQGPVEIVATPQEALDLYLKLGEALGAAQRAGVIQ
jgi:hypothetical protein